MYSSFRCMHNMDYFLNTLSVIRHGSWTISGDVVYPCSFIWSSTSTIARSFEILMDFPCSACPTLWKVVMDSEQIDEKVTRSNSDEVS